MKHTEEHIRKTQYRVDGLRGCCMNVVQERGQKRVNEGRVKDVWVVEHVREEIILHTLTQHR